jgi:hypothetical protein
MSSGSSVSESASSDPSYDMDRWTHFPISRVRLAFGPSEDEPPSDLMVATPVRASEEKFEVRADDVAVDDGFWVASKVLSPSHLTKRDIKAMQGPGGRDDLVFALDRTVNVVYKKGTQTIVLQFSPRDFDKDPFVYDNEEVAGPDINFAEDTFMISSPDQTEMQEILARPRAEGGRRRKTRRRRQVRRRRTRRHVRGGSLVDTILKAPKKKVKKTG